MTEKIENNSYSKHFIINKSNSSKKFKILPYYNKFNRQLLLNKNLNENFSFHLKNPNSFHSKKIKKINYNNNIFPYINNITTFSNPFRYKKHKSLKKLKLNIINESKKNNNIDSFYNPSENKNNNTNINKFNFKTEEYLINEKKYIKDLSKISNPRKKILQLNDIHIKKSNKNKKNFKSLSPLHTNSKLELNKVISQIHFKQNDKKIQSTIIDLSKQKNKLNKFYQSIKNLLNRDYEKYYNIPLEDLIQ